MAERRQQFTDPVLERALRAVGTEVAYPPTPEVASTVRRRIAAQPIRPRPWWLPSPAARRRLTFALALLLVIALALGAFPPVRKGIARRLGLANVEIINVTAVPSPTPLPTATSTETSAASAIATATPATPTGTAPTMTATPTPDTLGLGARTTLADAQVRVAFTVRAPGLPDFSTPDEVYIGQPPPGGRVSLLYRVRSGLPGIAGTEIGLLLQEFRGGIDAGYFGKGIPPGSRVEPVTINGAQGYWIEGGLRFFVYRDANGVTQTENTRVAGNTLLWEQGGVVYRLESSLPKDAAIRIAERDYALDAARRAMLCL